MLLAALLLAPCGVLGGVLDLPARRMWGWSPPGGRAPATASGYCGSMSLQTAAIYYGSWLSQDAIRGTSGGHNGKHSLLIGGRGRKAETSACAALKLNCSAWDFDAAPNPQSARFLQWASAAIDAGQPVIMGLYWAEESDPDYDHIVPMVGYSEDAVYFNDLHSNTTTRAELPGFVSNRKHCTGSPDSSCWAALAADCGAGRSKSCAVCAGRLQHALRAAGCSAADIDAFCRGDGRSAVFSWRFCLPKSVDYGVIVRGNSDAERGGMLPLRLQMASNWEPDYSKEDRLDEAPAVLNATLTASGLGRGGRYALLRYDDPASIPSSDLLGSGGYASKTLFEPANTVGCVFVGEWKCVWPVSFMSNSTTLFRCVAAPQLQAGGGSDSDPPAISGVVVAVDLEAAAPEVFAAQQLAHFLSLEAGAEVPLLAPAAAKASGKTQLAVGAAAAVAVGVSASDLRAGLGEDGFVCSSAADLSHVALSGGVHASWPRNANGTATRGTVNAVFEYRSAKYLS